MKLTIVIAVYNEKQTILQAIEEVKSINVAQQIIVIDNCSTDGTREILEQLNDNSVEIVFQPKNYGYGESVIKGFDLASGDYVFVQYSDLEYDSRCIFEMIKLVEDEDLDVVFGSRILNQKNRSIFSLIWERHYYLATIIATSLINAWYKRDFTDVIGIKLYKTKSIKEIYPISNRGMGFDFEVVSKLSKRGYKIKEVPVKYNARKASQGKKIKASHSFNALLAMLKVKFFD